MTHTRKSEMFRDLLLMSGGFTPSVHLFSQSRGKVVYDESIKAYIPGQRPSASDPSEPAGASSILALSLPMVSAAALTRSERREESPPRNTNSRYLLNLSGRTAIGLASKVVKRGGRAWVDFQSNDVTVKDIELATRQGFRSIEHVKRYTTTGMATDQGKTSNMNALGIVSQALDLPVSMVGLTTFRCDSR